MLTKETQMKIRTKATIRKRDLKNKTGQETNKTERNEKIAFKCSILMLFFSINKSKETRQRKKETKTRKQKKARKKERKEGRKKEQNKRETEKERVKKGEEQKKAREKQRETLQTKQKMPF